MTTTTTRTAGELISVRTVFLHGTVERDGGMLVVRFDKVTWGTSAPGFDELMDDIPRMITDYVNIHTRSGTFLREIRNLCRVDVDEVPDVMCFEVQLRLNYLRNEATTNFPVSVPVPKSATA